MSEENLTGAPISIAWDKENGEDFINIRDQNGKLIMKVHKKLWDDGGGTEFTPEVRDSIMTHARKLFG